MMQLPKKWWVAVAIVVLLGLGCWLIVSRATVPVTSPTPVVTTPALATSTASAQATTTPHSRAFPINPSDHTISWNFKGAYSGNDTLVAHATADAAHLTSLLGKGQYDDYDLYIGLGNDADGLGNGTSALSFYNKAIAIHPAKGLAYVNTGHLMDELGASYSAVDAYAKAVAVEPGMLEYHLERLNYLKNHFGSSTTLMLGALTDASKQFGDVAQVLTIEAQWLTDQKKYADAITAWESVKTLSSGRDTSAIDAAIVALKAKQ